ncbi:MAG: peptidylprolyl isomerase [Simkaniaceae bacterium]|nr:peptidylprolyl isomerase [Simkaniaceae bacterium]
MMTRAKKGDTVQVHYTGKIATGEVFDSSLEREPLEFCIGERKLIPGFEEALVGMQLGESKTITIASHKAYGDHDETLVSSVDRNLLPKELPLEEGTKLQIGDENEIPTIVTVTKINEEQVTLDANHPLAGKDLTFDIKLISFT